MLIRIAAIADSDAIWEIMKPIVRAGETYTLPRDIGKENGLTYWFSAEHEVFVAEENGDIVGTYFLQANQKGRRGARRELRVHDGVFSDGPWRGAGDVYAFAGASPGTRISRDAI